MDTDFASLERELRGSSYDAGGEVPDTYSDLADTYINDDDEFDVADDADEDDDSL